jgi:hypothetical protein
VAAEDLVSMTPQLPYLRMDAVDALAPAVRDAELTVDVDGDTFVGDEQGQQRVAEQGIVPGSVRAPAALAR